MTTNDALRPFFSTLDLTFLTRFFVISFPFSGHSKGVGWTAGSQKHRILPATATRGDFGYRVAEGYGVEDGIEEACDLMCST